MFAGRYYAPHYFAGRYFPHGTAFVTVKPSYFFHGYFSAKYYADRYFPGEYSTVTPPIPPPSTVIGVGGFARERFQPEIIRALVRLVLPVPEIRVHAQYIPPSVTAEIRLELDVALHVLATASPADVRAAIQAVAPWVDVEQVLVDIYQPRQKRSADDSWEEDLILEHYLLSLKDYQS